MWSGVRPYRSFPAAALVCALAAAIPVSASAQTRYRANPSESLAWWQLNPHLNHLWATTCQGDPSWRPGEGVSVGQAAAYVRSLQKRFGYAAIMDTIIPLYPRRRVRAVCDDAVQAEVTVGDTVRWQNVKGRVAIQASSINTGLKMRDDFLHGLIGADRYREITFQIDSLVSVQPGDTIKAVAVGVLSVHGVSQPLRIPVTAFHEADGLRVMGQVMQPASALTDVYGLSRMKLGLGVGLNLWKELHMGIDIVLVKQQPGASP
jgi:polyisoprenoid-binding protein YceI